MAPRLEPRSRAVDVGAVGASEERLELELGVHDEQRAASVGS